MPDGIQTYVEDVVCYADLAAPDERTVRAELAEHLQTLATLSHLSDPKEIYAMLKDQFGNPKTVGRAIASAKGRLRTYFKKLRRKLPWQIGIALILGFAVRFSIAQEFYVAGDGVSPMVPRGSRVLVYKLAQSFDPGDVIVYRLGPGEFRVGMVVCQRIDGEWVVQKNHGAGKEIVDVPREQIVGRVFLNTR
jgi:hypothetical protein